MAGTIDDWNVTRLFRSLIIAAEYDPEFIPQIEVDPKDGYILYKYRAYLPTSNIEIRRRFFLLREAYKSYSGYRYFDLSFDVSSSVHINSILAYSSDPTRIIKLVGKPMFDKTKAYDKSHTLAVRQFFGLAPV